MVSGVALMCTACQVYAPITLSPQTMTSTPVRVTLTNDGTYRLQPSLGTGAAQLDGVLTDVTDSTIAVKITDVTRVNGLDETWNGEPVTLPRNDISLVEHRTTSVARSILVAGAIVVVAVAAGSLSGTAAGAGNPPTPVGVK